MKGPVFTPKCYKMGGQARKLKCIHRRKKSKQKKPSLRGSTCQTELKTAIMGMFKELKTTMLKRRKIQHQSLNRLSNTVAEMKNSLK